MLLWLDIYAIRVIFTIDITSYFALTWPNVFALSLDLDDDKWIAYRNVPRTFL